MGSGGVVMMELDYKAIGRRVKFARIRAELTQEQLAERVGLSIAYLSNIETGSTKVSLSTVVKLANTLGVTLDDLMCDNVVHATYQICRDIEEILKDCDPYEIRIVRDIIEATKATLRRDANLRGENE